MGLISIFSNVVMFKVKCGSSTYADIDIYIGSQGGWNILMQ